jgi:lipopolysaccharide/colanic/teichoic acid biosynthesis glycosyltransferase/cellulose synthase/poly-beta-1,6-N-acetylglucosamine synthase-like glycosyltransferase
MNALLETVTLASLALTGWHHAGFPLLLRRIARPQPPVAPVPAARLPDVTLIMPAYNEAGFIAEKLRNLAALDYPADRLRVVVACDGCTDATAWLARAELEEPACAHLRVEVIQHEENRGKVAVLNETISAVRDGIVMLSDVSAMLPADALTRLVAHFDDPRVGAAGGSYGLLYPTPGEARYWPYQIAVKRGEAALAAPLGLHGAFYGFRREAWGPVPADTINDDFVLPMQILGHGWRVTYDDAIVALEAEPTDPAAELRRRRRIAAGNAQQLIRMAWLLSPARGRLALAFGSGKALRVLAPALLALGVLGSIALAPFSTLFAVLAVLQLAGLGAALLGRVLPRPPRLCAVAWYLLAGHAASFVGVVRYLAGLDRRPWRRAFEATSVTYLPGGVLAAKRATDIVIASIALLLSLPAWPLIALAVKLESRGPVLFRQLRIGRAMPDRTELFQMIKFRSMRSDAEARSGAVWAQKRDPRITRVGRLLRKTRLDEIPQLINVIRGDMAIVGPRPERPGFYRKLENAIPFFAERTVGLRPGITGFAQVNQGYDTSLDDVRRKVTFDHAYAMRLLDLRSWLSSDTEIMARTIGVMVLGRGQ